jgi:hypothetical protein
LRPKIVFAILWRHVSLYSMPAVPPTLDPSAEGGNERGQGNKERLEYVRPYSTQCGTHGATTKATITGPAAATNADASVTKMVSSKVERLDVVYGGIS